MPIFIPFAVYGAPAFQTPATQSMLANTPGQRGVQQGERLCSLFGAHNNPATTDAFVDAYFDVQVNRDAMGIDGPVLSD